MCSFLRVFSKQNSRFCALICVSVGVYMAYMQASIFCVCAGVHTVHVHAHVLMCYVREILFQTRVPIQFSCGAYRCVWVHVCVRRAARTRTNLQPDEELVCVCVCVCNRGTRTRHTTTTTTPTTNPNTTTTTQKKEDKAAAVKKKEGTSLWDIFWRFTTKRNMLEWRRSFDELLKEL